MSLEQKRLCVPLTASEYSTLFASFLEVSDHNETMKILVEPVLREFQGKSVKFMSIGAGNGCFEDSLVKEQGLLLDYFHAIEPDANFRAELQGVVKDWNTKCFIDERYFHRDFKTDEKFDLVLLSHVLYNFADPVPVILAAKSFLKRNGKLVILHQTKVGFCDILWRFFELFNYSSPLFTHQALTIEEISNDLDKLSLYHKLSDMASHVDLTEFVQKQETPHANHVVSFKLNTIYEKLPEDVQEEIHSLIKENCMQDANGRFFLKNQVGMLVMATQN